MQKLVIGVMDSELGGLNRFVTDYMISWTTKYEFLILSNGTLNEVYANELDVHSVKYIVQVIPCVMRPFLLYHETLNFFKKKLPDSLYLNVSTNLFYPVLQAAANCNVKERVVHSHSSYSANENFFKRNLVVILNILLQKKVNRLTTKRKACSSKAAKWLFGKKAEYDFIYNKVNGQKFFFDFEKRQKYRKELGLENFLIIGFVGGFNYQKNIFYFFDIARKLKKIRKDFCIVMLGNGELKGTFEIKLKKYNLESYFRLLGNRANVNEYYNMFDCLVMPSRFEGLPIVGIEAQINGLRCFFSDRITAQTKITEECEYFSLNKINYLIKILAKLEIRNCGSLHKLPNFKDFIF